jgi:RNA polymerase sigma-70 factor (ECF subfamily)
MGRSADIMENGQTAMAAPPIPSLRDSHEGPRLELGPELRRAVERLRRGIEVEASFATIDALLRPRLLRYFQGHPRDAADPEDLVQRTLTRVYRGAGGLSHEDRFLGWLFVIARNVLHSAARERRGTPVGLEEVEQRIGIPPVDTVVAAEEGRRLERLNQAIATLPPQQQQCLILRLRDELSYGDIAIQLRLSVHTVRNHLAAAKKALRGQLDPSVSGKARP